MQMLKLENIIWREGKYFVAQCLNADVSSFGETKEEALKNLQEALELYFEDNPGAEFSQVQEPELIPSIIKHG